MLLRCTCCRRWTVRDDQLDGRTVLRVRFQDRPMKTCATPLEVQRYLDPDVYASLGYVPEEPGEPHDGGCE